MTTDTRPDPVTAFLAADRKRAGLIFLAFALLWAAPAGYCGYKALKGSGAAVKKDADKEKDKEKSPESPPEEADKVAPPDPNFNFYFVTAVLGGLGAVVAAAGGLWLLAAMPSDFAGEPAGSASGVPPGEITRARKAVLAVGVLCGLVLMLIGLWYFVALFDLLTKWLNTGEAKDAWKVLSALLVFVAGAGMAFAAAQPARAEERNNQHLRLLVYGSNLAISVLLLMMLLITANVVASVKLPNKLDTTEAGFFSLQPKTESYIRQLDQKVTVYVMLPEEGGLGITDMRRLLQAAQEINPDKFVVKYTSITTLADAQRLRTKFPAADVEDYGLIVAVGDDESRYSFLRASDFIKREGGGRFGEGGKASFQGEVLLVKELAFLAENKAKPIVYVTQGHGELTLDDAGPNSRPTRSMAALKTALEKNNVDVRPLTFELKAAKVPDDATVLVVADPTASFAPEEADAIGKYLNTPKADGKKGKLFAILGPHPGVNKEVQPSGLEGVLGQFNITLPQMYMYTQPSKQLPPEFSVLGVTSAAMAARIPAAQMLQETAVLAPDCQPVDAARQGQGGNPAVQAVPLLATIPQYITWLEKTKPPSVDDAFAAMMQNPNLIAQKQARRATRGVAAVATEGGAGRVVVIGSGGLFSDDYAKKTGEGNPATQLLTTSVDWLRERGEVTEVVNKPFEVYSLSADYDWVRMYMLPLLLSVLVLGALGAGVWVVRRK